MSSTTPAARIGAAARVGAGTGRTVFPILFTITACHMINDTLQAVLPAVYPILARSFRLSYGQIGLITLVFQCTASLLQPLIGMATDRRPKPWSLPAGMVCMMVGLLLLSRAPTYGAILLAAGLVGFGSAMFHPESSRVARLASGGRFGMAQSLFQMGGNTGTSFGPLLAAFIVLPFGQHAIALFAVIALLGVALLARVSAWYSANLAPRGAKRAVSAHGFSSRHVALAITVLVVLVFSKVVYLSSLTNYYMFYLMHRFGLSVYSAQLHLFLFLGAVAAGTFAGGPIGDRIGRRAVIWVSILGTLPFSLLLPHVGLATTTELSILIGLILSSAFSAIVVFAQELLPGHVGTVAGLFFGGNRQRVNVALGLLADHAGIDTVYQVCAFLPAIGLLAVFLPRMQAARA